MVSKTQQQKSHLHNPGRRSQLFPSLPLTWDTRFYLQEKDNNSPTKNHFVWTFPPSQFSNFFLSILRNNLFYTRLQSEIRVKLQFGIFFFFWCIPELKSKHNIWILTRYWYSRLKSQLLAQMVQLQDLDFISWHLHRTLLALKSCCSASFATDFWRGLLNHSSRSRLFTACQLRLPSFTAMTSSSSYDHEETLKVEKVMFSGAIVNGFSPACV